MRLGGAVALVTGASSGIGRATALDLAAAGATVVGVARREPLLRDLAAEMARRGTPGETAVCDVTDAAAVERTVAGVVERHGRVDVLVNNVGDYRPLVRFEKSGPESWDAMIRINLYHFYAVTHAFARRTDVHLPVDAQRIGAARRHRLEPGATALREEDARHDAAVVLAGEARQHALGVCEREFQVGGGREE